MSSVDTTFDPNGKPDIVILAELALAAGLAGCDLSSPKVYA